MCIRDSVKAQAETLADGQNHLSQQGHAVAIKEPVQRPPELAVVRRWTPIVSGVTFALGMLLVLRRRDLNSEDPAPIEATPPEPPI